MRIHRWLDFKVTQACNNADEKCAYCDVPVVPPGSSEALSLSEIHRTLLDARVLGFDTYWFLGGEPSVREDIAEVFDPLAGEENVSLAVVTNGRLARWDMVDALFATRAERACVQFSMDSLRPDSPKRCDPKRVLGVIERTKERARSASRRGHSCEVEVHSVITRHNLHDFDATAMLLARGGIPTSFAIVCPWEVVEEPTTIRQFTEAEVGDIARRLRALKTGYAIDAFNASIADFVEHLRNGNRGPRSCGAGLTHLVINADGLVHRCMAESFVRGTELGSVRTMRLHDVLRKVKGPRQCQERPECFDGFAWDRLALVPRESPPA